MLKYRSLTKDILDRPITGVGLKPGTLRHQFRQGRPLLMVFLRHLACQFSKETVRDIRAAQNQDPEYPDILFVFQESSEAGQIFLNQYWPRGKAISDPNLFFYGEFGIPTAGLLDLTGPRALLASVRATAKGNLHSWPRGNLWQMPGFFVVTSEQIVWSHHCQHVGDRPPLQRMTYFLHSLKLGLAGKAQKKSEANGKHSNIKPLVRAS